MSLGYAIMNHVVRLAKCALHCLGFFEERAIRTLQSSSVQSFKHHMLQEMKEMMEKLLAANGEAFLCRFSWFVALILHQTGNFEQRPRSDS